MYIEEALKKFSELPIEVKMIIDGDFVVGKISEIEKEYQVELSDLVVFVTISELNIDDIPIYLQRERGLDKELADRLSVILEENIFKPLIARLNFLNPSPDKDFSLLEEKAYLKFIFKENLVNEISDYEFIRGIINEKIFHILGVDLSFANELERLLYYNQEQIANFSITNWFQDFISQKGSAMFNDIALTDYIAHSFNCQKLNDENRRLVRKLLILYRNLKFFPASMPNDTGEDWEIIPIDDKVREFNRGALGAPKTAEEKNIDVLQAESQGYGADSLEKKVIEEKISNEKKIEGLRIMANRYPEGSLEWRALMDEANKLTKN